MHDIGDTVPYGAFADCVIIILLCTVVIINILHCNFIFFFRRAPRKPAMLKGNPPKYLKMK